MKRTVTALLSHVSTCTVILGLPGACWMYMHSPCVQPTQDEHMGEGLCVSRLRSSAFEMTSSPALPQIKSLCNGGIHPGYSQVMFLGLNGDQAGPRTFVTCMRYIHAIDRARLLCLIRCCIQNILNQVINRPND